MNHSLTTATFALLIASLVVGCDDKAKTGEGSASTASAAVSAPKAESKAAPAGDVGASKVEKALAEWQADDVKAALEKSGWKVTGSSQTKSAMLAINVSATKGETKAKVDYYKNGGDFWKKRLVKDNAAIHEDGDVIVGVTIEGDKDAAQKLLDSLVGK